MKTIRRMLQELLAILTSGRAPNPRELLYFSAINHLGRDASPNDEAPDELGCADTISEIYFATFQEWIGDTKTVSTWTMKGQLDRSEKFQKVETPDFGDIIISETRWVGKEKQVGHVGIILKDGMIASNNSFGANKGKFTANFTLASWKAYYQDKKRLPVSYYRRI